METRASIGQRIAQFVSLRIGTIVVILTLGLIVFSICGYVFEWDWTGLPSSINRGQKTLWDWFDLFIIPVVLAAGAIWFRKTQADTARELEQQRAQEATLEAYLDNMSNLLLHEGLRESEPGSAVQDLARTRTLLVLRRLDLNRRNHVLRFLADAWLLGRVNPLGEETEEAKKARIALLAKADMEGMDLSGAKLNGVNLSWSNLSGANLRDAEFRWANLYSARLRGSDLRGADFGSANLTSAKFYRAKLRGADMGDANLDGAHFGSADLRGAKNITCDQLRKALKFESAYRDESLACGLPIPNPPADQD